MSIDEILDQFIVSPKGFPYKAVAAAEKIPEEITPYLLRLLEDVVTDPDHLGPGDIRYIFAMFLLAKFREPEACARIVDIATMPREQVDWILGDSITEDLHRWLASVANGDLTHIDRLIRDKDADDFARGAGIRAISVMAFHGLLDRDTTIGYLRTLFHELERDRKQMVVWTSLVMATAELSIIELANEIDQVFEDKLFDLAMTDYEDIVADLHRGLGKNFEQVFARGHDRLIDDVTKEMAWWPVWRPPVAQKQKVEPRPLPDTLGQQPRPTVVPAAPRPVAKIQSTQPGRNDPCPCGSGKKYKKCHGKKG